MAADRDPPHVLVIDDDAAILGLYQDLLEDDGYRVTVWSSPHLDPAGVRALTPDVIVLDLLIGRADVGLRFLQRLKTDPATAAIPVLVSSADHTLAEQARDHLAVRDCGTVRKPFDIDEFLTAVRACLVGAASP